MKKLFAFLILSLLFYAQSFSQGTVYSLKTSQGIFPSNIVVVKKGGTKGWNLSFYNPQGKILWEKEFIERPGNIQVSQGGDVVMFSSRSKMLFYSLLERKLSFLPLSEGEARLWNLSPEGTYATGGRKIKGIKIDSPSIPLREGYPNYHVFDESRVLVEFSKPKKGARNLDPRGLGRKFMVGEREREYFLYDLSGKFLTPFSFPKEEGILKIKMWGNDSVLIISKKRNPEEFWVNLLAGGKIVVRKKEEFPVPLGIPLIAVDHKKGVVYVMSMGSSWLKEVSLGGGATSREIEIGKEGIFHEVNSFFFKGGKIYFSGRNFYSGSSLLPSTLVFSPKTGEKEVLPFIVEENGGKLLSSEVVKKWGR